VTRSRFFLAPILVFFDFKIYREIVELPLKKSFLYLVYLAGLWTLFFFIVGLVNLPKINSLVEWTKVQWTGMTLSHSGMQLDRSGRQELNHPQFGPLAVFDDTRDFISPEEMGHYRLYMTSKMIYIQHGSDIQGSVIGGRGQREFQTRVDRDTIHRLYHSLKWFVAAFALVFIFISGFLSRLAAASLLALLGLGIQLFFPHKLRFEQLFALSVFCLSVGLVFSLFQWVPDWQAFFPDFLGPILVCVYFAIAISVQQPIPEKTDEI
jgi:hypothetical protein